MLSSDQLRGPDLACSLWGLYRTRVVVQGAGLAALLAGVSSQADSLEPESAALAAWAVSRLWANSRAAGAGAQEAGQAGQAGAVLRRRRRWHRIRAAGIARQEQQRQAEDRAEGRIPEARTVPRPEPAQAPGPLRVPLGPRPAAPPSARGLLAAALLARSRRRRQLRSLLRACLRRLLRQALPASPRGPQLAPPPLSPRAVAMCASSLAFAGPDAPPLPARRVRALLDATLHCASASSASSSSGAGFDAASLVTTLAALRRLRPPTAARAGSSPRASPEDPSSPLAAATEDRNGWERLCGAAWASALCQAAAPHVPRMQAPQLAALMQGLAGTCGGPSEAAHSRLPPLERGAAPEPWWLQQQQQQRPGEEGPTGGFELLAIATVARLRQLAEARRRALELLQQQQQQQQQQPSAPPPPQMAVAPARAKAGRRRRQPQPFVPPALLPVQMAGLATSLLALRVRLPPVEAQWLQLQLSAALHHLPPSLVPGAHSALGALGLQAAMREGTNGSAPSAPAPLPTNGSHGDTAAERSGDQLAVPLAL
jgi:hypothetical protein